MVARGSSLLEIVTVMALGALLLAMSVPQFSRLSGPYASRAAVQQLRAAVDEARLRAIMQNRRQRITLNAGTSSYTIEREVSPNTFAVEGGVRKLPRGVTLGSLATDTIVFDTRGTIVSAVTIPLTAPGTRVRTVGVNVLGQTTID
jgi:Tfp pilus assembly protein FimT